MCEAKVNVKKTTN